MQCSLESMRATTLVTSRKACHSKWIRATMEFASKICRTRWKHIRIQCPLETGTLFHNCKGFFSLVLMPVCDGNYCFTLIDIGEYGSNNDSEVLCRSEMGKRLSAVEMHLPESESLPGCPFDSLSFYLLGDEIFSLKTWLMRPYPGKVLQENNPFTIIDTLVQDV